MAPHDNNNRRREPRRRCPAFVSAVASLLLVSILLPTTTDATVSAQCLSACERGTCVNDDPSGGAQSARCVCDDGWGGADCSLPYEMCPDGLRKCFNGSVCKRREGVGASGSLEEGESRYECDCSIAFGVTAYAGHECEMAAMKNCEYGTPASRYAFCTNGGECREVVLSGEPHIGCHCSDEFEGAHCQYLKGTAPPEAKKNIVEEAVIAERIDEFRKAEKELMKREEQTRTNSDAHQNGKIATPVIVTIVLSCLAFIGIIVIVVWKRGRDKKQKEEYKRRKQEQEEVSNSGQMECDFADDENPEIEII